jgi:hypothetical protein
MQLKYIGMAGLMTKASHLLRFFCYIIKRRLMQTEVVELLPYNAVKVLVEYGHNIPSKSDSEEPVFKLHPLFVAGIPSCFWSLVHH